MFHGVVEICGVVEVHGVIEVHGVVEVRGVDKKMQEVDEKVQVMRHEQR